MKVCIASRSRGFFFARFTHALLVLLVLAAVQSCTEHPDEIGLDLIEKRAQVHRIDTLTIHAMTHKVDSMYLPLSQYNMLGIMQDPVFGKLRSSVYAETRLPENNLFLGEDPVLDSVMLALRYAGTHYGSLDHFQLLTVHELTERFPDVDSLYTNIAIPYREENINWRKVPYIFRPSPADSVTVDSVQRPPQMRIRLSDEFGNKLLDASGTEAFANMENYLEAFSGLYITLDEQTHGLGALFEVDLLSQFSAIELYYQAAEDTVQQMQRFPINEYSARANRTDHFDHSGAHELLLAQIEAQDRDAADSVLFLQTPGLLRPHIHFPFIESLRAEKSLLVNKAELIIPVAGDLLTEDLPATPELFLARLGEDGSLRLLDDYYVGREFFGGRLDEDTLEYRFNIAVYLQKLLDGVRPSEDIALIFTDPSREMGRVAVHGPGRTERPMRLIIYYTEFE